jgi:hypothetical protein
MIPVFFSSAWMILLECHESPAKPALMILPIQAVSIRAQDHKERSTEWWRNKWSFEKFMHPFVHLSRIHNSLFFLGKLHWITLDHIGSHWNMRIETLWLQTPRGQTVEASLGLQPPYGVIEATGINSIRAQEIKKLPQNDETGGEMIYSTYTLKLA